jgi:hypothetical protein
MYEQMARITIQPRWARYYDFGAGRVPGFLLKLAQGNPDLQVDRVLDHQGAGEDEARLQDAQARRGHLRH